MTTALMPLSGGKTRRLPPAVRGSLEERQGEEKPRRKTRDRSSRGKDKRAGPGSGKEKN